MRITGIALCVSLVVLIGVSLVGRAVDAEVQQRVLITRGGWTLDCERHVAREGEVVRFEDSSSVVAKAGEVFYRDCNRVP